MTKWAHSLIRLSKYEVETLQKRLAEVSARRASAEMRLAVLDAEHEVERERAAGDAYAAMQMAAYVQGWRLRRAAAQSTLEEASAEEAGARDALAQAFEEQKKFEHVAELSRLSEKAKVARIETAQLDETALRRATR
ncbi:MAG TPA: flagellar FliJ family protein [Caulobacteraceae bacterium]|jgi:flagellar export protein FliJ|nr:flagellar FliJ family protein [Caulobacteraceae bacterium]